MRPIFEKQNNKNNKPQKRGLGIAKLEKILREEKDKEENKMVVAEFSSRLLSALPLRDQSSSFYFLYPIRGGGVAARHNLLWK